MRARLTRDVKGMSYTSGKPDGTPFLYPKGSEGTVIRIHETTNEAGESKNFYYLRMDCQHLNSVIVVNKKACVIVGEAANLKDIKINKFKERLW